MEEHEAMIGGSGMDPGRQIFFSPQWLYPFPGNVASQNSTLGSAYGLEIKGKTLVKWLTGV